MNEEYTRRRVRRRRQHRRKKKRRRAFAILIILILAAAAIMALISYFSTDVYQDEEEFEKYAEEMIETSDVLDVSGDVKTTYTYESPISYAVNYQVSDEDSITEFRNEKISEKKKAFKKKQKEEEAKREKKTEDDEDYKPLEHALIVNAAVYESENGAISLAIQYTEVKESDKEMITSKAYVDTYLFSAETGNLIAANQALQADYRSNCEDYFKDYFAKQYSEEELESDWKEHLSDDNDNFADFVLTDDDCVFYFDAGTIIDKSAGVVAVKASNEDLGDIVRSELIERYIDPDEPMVAITYDDGPGGESEKRIIKYLEQYGAVATFFYVGSRVSSAPENIEKALNIGCELGNHTWSHPLLTDLSKSKIANEIKKTNAVVREACGQEPTVFRPCYGATNDKVNKTVNLPVIMWDLDTLDWKSRKGSKVFEVIKKSGNLDGKIILMHSIYDSTADATKKLLPWLQKKGYQTVTVSELIKYKTGKPAKSGEVY